jgi:thioesterase domain-containing protein
VIVNGEGGNLIGFRSLVNAMPGTGPVWGLQSAGLDGVTQPDRTIEEMAERYVSEVSEAHPSGPLVLAGYCMGGSIAYEMARQMAEAGRQVDGVVMIDSYTAAFLRVEIAGLGPLARARYYGAEWATRERMKQQAFGSGYVRQRASTVLSTVSEVLAKPQDEHELATAATLDAVSEANRNAFYAYQPRPYDGRVVQIRPKYRPDDGSDVTLGWADCATSCSVVTIGKYRFQLWIEPHLSQLATAIEAETHLPLVSSG